MPLPAPTAPTQSRSTNERIDDEPISGIGFLVVLFLLVVFSIFLLSSHNLTGIGALGLIVCFFGFILCVKGLMVLEPNTAAAFTLFGNYTYTIRKSGFFWVNPFFERMKVSMRVENFNTDTLKVNDKLGNPIEIAAVITWRVNNVARALFDVQGYARYIQIQSEMGLRDVASSHSYDSSSNDEVTLRGNSQVISDMLKSTVQNHVDVAGIEILGVKLMHLAYAPEIAGVMLRRQQASAIIQARELLVEGAVGMVKITLDRLEKEGIATLTPPERAALVTNMMTVLLSEDNAQPVIQMSQATN
ncbi:MAG TPA: SPFH domain-containing protein [Alphaproteobacteria bacterium]|nr:SPFH domain-containing protein [Alphaproteobacteria bacterium]